MVEAKPKNWRWWIIVSALAIVVLILLGVALWAAISVLPPVLVERQLRSDISHTDRLKEIDTVRTSLLGPLATLIGAMAVLAGAGVAYLNFRGTLELNRRGQVTDRFTKAIEQIGQADEKKLNARIGGVYALEQIAKDSKDLHWPVIQTLTAYLREHSVEPLQPTAEQVKEGAVESRKETATPSRPSRADFLAVADVIRRRRWEWDPKAVIRRRSWEWDSSAGLDIEGTTGPEPLDLEGCNLRRAVLENAHLERADFQRAQLEEARFEGAHLQGADFLRALAQEANFMRAQLDGAYFGSAQLRQADFRLTQLQGAYFEQAQLHGAYFEGAKLQQADFRGAQLQGAYFEGANLQQADFRGAQLQGANFREAQLQGANFEGVDLSGTVLMSQEQLDSAICNKATKPRPGLTVKAKSATAATPSMG